MISVMTVLLFSACSNNSAVTGGSTGDAPGTASSHERTFILAYQSNVDGEIEPCG